MRLSIVMAVDVSIALAATCLGIALAGAMSAIRGPLDGRERVNLMLVFCVFAGVTSTQLIYTYALPIYGFYLPVVLVLLLILPPAVFYYVVAKTTELDASMHNWRDAALPGVGGLVMIGFWLQPSDTKTTMFIAGDLPEGVVPATLAFLTFALIFCWIVSSCLYLIATLKRLRAYRSKLRSLYSNLDNRELRWLDWFVVSLVALWAAAAVTAVADNTGFGQVPDDALIYGLTACLLLFVMAFASIVPPPPDDDAPEISPNTAEAKYARSALTTVQAEKVASRIASAMEKDALYLDPNLSLQKLSRHVGALPNQVSQTLNEQIGSTFFDYIAHHRVRAAKPLLLEGNASTLNVSLDVGFNSRSTFYKAFKREIGITPKAFRETAAN